MASQNNSPATAGQKPDGVSGTIRVGKKQCETQHWRIRVQNAIQDQERNLKPQEALLQYWLADTAESDERIPRLPPSAPASRGSSAILCCQPPSKPNSGAQGSLLTRLSETSLGLPAPGHYRAALATCRQRQTVPGNKHLGAQGGCAWPQLFGQLHSRSIARESLGAHIAIRSLKSTTCSGRV